MNLLLTIEILKKGDWFIAKAPELDFVSQGRTVEEAKRNLLEVIEIQFREMKDMGTLDEYLAELGFEIKDDTLVSQAEIVGFEKSMVKVS